MGVNITFSLQESCGSESGLLEEFLTPFLELVTGHLERGEGVLVHCMAGIHRCSPCPTHPRAGAAGVMAVAVLRGLTMVEALAEVRKGRPGVELIGDLPLLLHRAAPLLRHWAPV